MPPAARSVEESFPLIEFCRNGNLKATSEWIAKGNPLDLPPGKKTRRASPLQIAIEKGFLTLTEVLLNGGADQLASNGSACGVISSACSSSKGRSTLSLHNPNVANLHSADPLNHRMMIDREVVCHTNRTYGPVTPPTLLL